MKIYLILSLIGLIFLAGCAQYPSTANTDKFVLTEDNFELTALTWERNAVGISSSVEGVCAEYKNYLEGKIPYEWDEKFQMQGFVISYNIKGLESTLQSNPALSSQVLKCFVIVDNVKWYSNIGINFGEEIGSSYFVDKPSGECGDGCFYARSDVANSNEITFCCDTICKSKVLQPACK